MILYLSNIRYTSKIFQPAEKLNDLFKGGQAILEEDDEKERDNE